MTNQNKITTNNKAREQRTKENKTKNLNFQRLLNTTAALLAISAEAIDDFCGLSDLSGRRGLYKFAHKLEMGEYQLSSAVQSLERNGFIERKEGGFLITPKGKRKIKFLSFREKIQKDGKWDGKWRVVIFDIPERLRSSRDIFRSHLVRNGFVKLQNSVFVCPFADFDVLDDLRYACGVEKYVNFLEATSVKNDNDTLLRKKFGL
jgi:phenylacetic acid degradation operon negative regulatory protein